jgi:hypothetical protein
MRKKITILTLTSICILLSNCTIIYGGAKYQAHIQVPDHPKAEIYYDGVLKGKGRAVFKVKRNHADNLNIELKKDGCKKHTHSFNSKKARPLAVIGSISEVSSMVVNQQAAIPLGSILDLLIGSYWKPNVKNPLINKIDYDNFQYILEYPGCPVSN